MPTHPRSGSRRPRPRRGAAEQARAKRRQRRWLLGGSAAVIVTALVVVATVRGGTSGSAQGVAIAGAPASNVGEAAPRFSAPTLSGQAYRSPLGRPILMYFMAGWCGTCVPQARAMGAVEPAVRGKVDLVAVDVDPSDSWSSLRSFAGSVGSPAYVFAKDDGKIGRAFTVTSLDVTIGIDASGRVAYRHLGGMDEAGVRSALDKIGVRS